MARRIIWSRRSQTDRRQIFTYWNLRNKSKEYSKKLNRLFVKAVEFISIFPHTGRQTTVDQVRIKFVSHYAILYEYSKTELRVLCIFDTRQDSEKFDRIIESE